VSNKMTAESVEEADLPTSFGGCFSQRILLYSDRSSTQLPCVSPIFDEPALNVIEL
jgi:hypothetical protein